MARLPPMLPVLLLVFFLAACGGGDTEEPPLRVDAIGQAATDALIADSVSAGLTARDAAGRVVPGLAQSWRVSDDGLSIVFRLREASFADGRQVRATDVLSSLQRARSGRAGALTRELMAGVTAVSAPLDTVVELRLSSPQPELLALLATPPLAIRPRGRAGTAGPFTADVELGEPVEPGTDPAIRLTRNAAFFDAAAVMLSAASVSSRSGDRAVERFNRGETELVLGGGLDGFGTARVTARRETLRLEQPRAALLLLVNTRRGKLADRGVRTALQLAINREALGPALFGSQAARPVAGIVPSSIAGYTPPLPDWAAQPMVGRQEEARRLLAEAGVEPVGARLRLEVASTDSDAETRLLNTVGADLAAVGIDLVLIRRAPADHAKALAAGEFELALTRRDAPINSPLPFLLPNRCGANRHGVCLPEADRLLAESWKAPSLAQRMATLAAAERLWAEDGASIGLVQPIDWSLVSPRVIGFVANASTTHALRHISLATDRKLLK